MQVLACLYFSLGLITAFVVPNAAATPLGIIAGLLLAYVVLGWICFASLRQSIKRKSLLTDECWVLNFLAPLSWIAGMAGGVWLALH
jgi:hypothetical protein